MSCHEESKRQTLLDHLKAHIALECPQCRKAMNAEDGALAFGNAMMARFICKDCSEERIFVIQEDGKILEAGA